MGKSVRGEGGRYRCMHAWNRLQAVQHTLGSTMQMGGGTNHTSVSYSSTLSMVATASTILNCGEDGCGPSGVAAVPLLERYRTGQKRTATGGLRPDGSANRGELLSGMMSVDDSVGEPARYS